MLNFQEKKNDERLNHNHFNCKSNDISNISICDKTGKNNVRLQKNMLVNNLKTDCMNGTEKKKTKPTSTHLRKSNNEMNNKKETNISKRKGRGKEKKKESAVLDMHDKKNRKTIEQHIIGCKEDMDVVKMEKGKEEKKDLNVEINVKERKELNNEIMKNASLEAQKECIQSTENVEQSDDDVHMEELHIKKCGLSSFFCCQNNKKKQMKGEKKDMNKMVSIEENGKEVKNIDWLIYTIRYMDYRRLRRRFNGIRKPISKKIVFIITIFCLILISWKNILTTYDDGMYIISFKIKSDIVFFVEAVFALIGIVIFAKFQTRLSLNWPIYASYIFIILAAVILLFSGSEKNESDSISEHILIIYGIVQLLLIIIVKIIIFIGPLLAAYGLFCPCTEHCRILKKKVSVNKLNITISRYNDLAGMCGNNLCCFCLCAYRSFYRAIRFFYNRCARCRIQINNGKLKRAPFSHQLRYKGKTDTYGRPHGYGEWIEDHSYGEKLRGFWFHGYPVGPFISQEIGSGSLFVNTRVGFVVSREKDLTDIRYGVACTECSISGPFFNDFPLTHFFNPNIEKNVNGRTPQNRYDIIVKDILKEDYESILSCDLQWCFNMLKINSGHTVESTSSKCVITLDHATRSLRVNNFKRLTPIKRKQNVLDEITVKLVKLSKYKKRKRILKKNNDGHGMENTHNNFCDNIYLHRKKKVPPYLQYLIDDSNKKPSSVFFEESSICNETKEKNNGVANTNVKIGKKLEKNEETGKGKIQKGYETKIDKLESPMINTVKKKESVQVCKSEMFDNPALFCDTKEKGQTDFLSYKRKQVPLYAEDNIHMLNPHNKQSTTDANCFSPCKKENCVELNMQNGVPDPTKENTGLAWNSQKKQVPFDMMNGKKSDIYCDIKGDHHMKRTIQIRFQKEDLLGKSNKDLLEESAKEKKDREQVRTLDMTGKTSYRKKLSKQALKKASGKKSLHGGLEEKSDIRSNGETANLDFLKLKAREENTTEGNETSEKHASNNKLCSASELEPTDKALDNNRTKIIGTRRIGSNKIIAHLKDNYKESINKKIKKINMSKSQHGKHKSFTSKQKMKSDLVKKKSLMFLSTRNIPFDNMFRSKNSLKGKNENILESFSKKMKNIGDAFNVNSFHDSNMGTQKKKLHKKIAQVFEEEDEWANYQQQNNQKIVVDGWKSLSLKRHLTVMPDEIVIYIHGYNVKLGQGCSQLAHLVSFSKLPSYIQPFVFHWEGSMWGPFSAFSYPVAKKRAEVPGLGEAFKNFIQRLIDLDIKNIHIISHSCGSRLFFNGFEKCVRDGLFYNMLKDEELEVQNGFTYNEKNRMKKKENSSSHSQESESSQEEDYSISSGESVYSDIHGDSFCNKEPKMKSNHSNKNAKNQKKKIFVKTTILINPDYSLKKFLEKDFFLIRTHCNHIVMYGDTRDQALTYAETWNREKSLGKRIFKLKLPLYKVHGYYDYLNVESNSNKNFVDSYEEKYRLCDSLLFPNSTQIQKTVSETAVDQEEEEEKEEKEKEKESMEEDGTKKKKKKFNHNGQYRQRKKKGGNKNEEDGDEDSLMKVHDDDRDYKGKELNLSANESCDEISITSYDGVYNELNENFLRTVDFSDSSFRSFKTKKKWNILSGFRRLLKGKTDSLSRTHVYYNNKNDNEIYNKNNVDITNASNSFFISKGDAGKSTFNVIHNNSDINCSFVGTSVQQLNVNEHGNISGRSPLKIGVKSTCNKGFGRNLPAQVFMKTDTVYISFDKYAWLDMDVIDTTFVETNVDFLKHSFYQVKREIIDDIREVMISNVRARERVSRLDRRRGNVFVLRVAPAGVGSLHR